MNGNDGSGLVNRSRQPLNRQAAPAGNTTFNQGFTPAPTTQHERVSSFGSQGQPDYNSVNAPYQQQPAATAAVPDNSYDSYAQPSQPQYEHHQQGGLQTGAAQPNTFDAGSTAATSGNMGYTAGVNQGNPTQQTFPSGNAYPGMGNTGSDTAPRMGVAADNRSGLASLKKSIVSSASKLFQGGNGGSSNPNALLGDVDDDKYRRRGSMGGFSVGGIIQSIKGLVGAGQPRSGGFGTRSMQSSSSSKGPLVAMLLFFVLVLYLGINNSKHKSEIAKLKDRVHDLKMGYDYELETIEFKTKLNNENLHLKAFVHSAHPRPNLEDVCIITHLSPDRLEKLEELAEVWKGPISAAIFVKSESEITGLASRLNALQSEAQLDVHAVWPKADLSHNQMPYPINFLRNVAWNQAACSTIFHVDVDFLPSQTHSDVKNGVSREWRSNSCNRNKCVFVAPSFNVHTTARRRRIRSKDDIRSLVSTNDAVASAPFWNSAHQAVDYDRWFTSSRSYEAKYELWFEPYLIFSRDDTPKFDPMFVYTGMNKASHALEISLSKRFIVLPNLFVYQTDGEDRGHFWSTKDNYESESRFLWNQIFLRRLVKEYQLPPRHFREHRLYKNKASDKVDEYNYQ